MIGSFDNLGDDFLSVSELSHVSVFFESSLATNKDMMLGVLRTVTKKTVGVTFETPGLEEVWGFQRNDRRVEDECYYRVIYKIFP